MRSGVFLNSLLTIVLVVTTQCFESRAIAQQEDAPNTAATPALDQFGTPAEAEAAFTQEQAEAWRDEMMPHVEKATGRTFTSKPQIKVSTRKQMVEALERDARDMAERSGIDLENPEMQQEFVLQMLDNAVRSAYWLGRYSTSEQCIYLPAGNVTPLLQIAGVDPSQMQNIMKIVIAHELAHALHEQQLPVGKRPTPKTSDHLRAIEAVNEGFATFIQGRVAKDINLTGADKQLRGVWELSGVQQDMAVSQRKQYEQKYIAGANFFEHHFKAGGIERVWQILENPPQTYLHITYPDRYGEAVAQRIDTKELFKGLSEIMGGSLETAQVLTIDGESACANFQVLGPERHADAKRIIQKAHTTIFPTSEGMRAATLFETPGNAEAKELVAIIDELSDVQLGRARSAASDKLKLEEQHHEMTIPGAEGVIRHATMTANETGGEPTVVNMAFAAFAHDTYVVQIIASGGAFSEQKVADSASKILSNLSGENANVPIAGVDDANKLVIALRRVRPWLGEGGWSEMLQQTPKESAARLLGDDIEGNLAMESGFVEAHSNMLEATEDDHDTRRMLAMTLIECNSVQNAEAVAKSVGANLKSFASRSMPIRRLDGPITEEALGVKYNLLVGQISAMGETSPISIVSAQYGKRVVYWFELNNTLDRSRIAELVRVLAE